MPLQHMGAWAPDALNLITDPSKEGNVAGEALGVLPGPTSYRPWPGPAANSLAAASALRGAGVPRLSGSSVGLFTGSATKLYKFAGPSSAWTDVTRSSGGNYALGTDDCWQFAQYGSTLVALDGVDAIQYIDANAGTHFAPLSGITQSGGGAPPSWAKFLAVSGDILMFANTSNDSKQVLWPGRNNITWWTPGQQDCDSQIFPDGGDIMGITGVENGGLIFQQDTVRQYFPRTDRAIFEFHRIEAGCGTHAPYSIIPYQGGAFYYSTRGFVAIGLDGQIKPIGYGLIDEWFLLNSAAKTRPKAIIGAFDPIKVRFFWLFANQGNSSSNYYDQILCFDPATVGSEHGPWTHANVQASYIFPSASSGVTIEGFDALGYTLETIPYSLDSDVWAGGAPAIAIFDGSNKLNFFTGNNLAAQVDTAIFAPIPGKRIFIRGFRPLCDVQTPAGQATSNIQGRVGTAERAEDFIVWSGMENLTAQGLIPARASGRFVRAEVDIGAGQVWNHLAGIDDIDLIADGER